MKKIVIALVVLGFILSPILTLASVQPKYQIIDIRFANKAEVEGAVASGFQYVDLDKKVVQPILDEVLFKVYGWSKKSVKTISYQNFLKQYKDYQIQKDNPIMFKNGNLVKVTPGLNIYLTENNLLRKIPGPKTFAELGYKWSQVFNIKEKSPLFWAYKIGDPIGRSGNYVYTNTQYGFGIELEKKYWQGYKITSTGSKDYRLDMISFSIPTVSKKWPNYPWAGMLDISVYTKDNWQNYQNACSTDFGPGCDSTPLAQSSQYVFVSGQGQDSPSDTVLTFGKGVQNALKTFKLTK
ncbi:MAG: hypothetical protein WC499_02390 [Patescibacteria group bacterium]